MKKMANKKILLTIPIIVFVIGMTVVGCEIGPKDDGEPKYLVRTGTMLYTDFQAIGREYDPGFTLGNNQWMNQELTVEEYNQYVSFYNSSQVSNKNQNNWTKNQLIDYFMGRGFDNAMANRAASLVVTTDHILIGTRSGSIVYVLLK